MHLIAKTLVAFCIAALATPAVADDRIEPEQFPKYVSQCEQASNKFACYMLANHYQSFPEADRDGAKFRKYTKMACDIAPRTGEKADFDRMLSGQTCTQLGIQLMNGQYGAKDLPASNDAFRRGCDAENLTSCAYLGEAYQTGRGVQPDEGQALAYYEKACDEKMPIGCYKAIRILLFEGLKNNAGSDTNPRLIFGRKAAAIACSTEWQAQGTSCWYSAEFHDNDWGGPAQPRRAIADFKTACEMTKQSDHCFFYGSALMRAPVEYRQVEQGQALIRKSCAEEYEPACDTAKRF